MSAHACVEPNSAQEAMISFIDAVSAFVENIDFSEIYIYDFIYTIAFNDC